MSNYTNDSGKFANIAAGKIFLYQLNSNRNWDRKTVLQPPIECGRDTGEQLNTPVANTGTCKSNNHTDRFTAAEGSRYSAPHCMYVCMDVWMNGWMDEWAFSLLAKRGLETSSAIYWWLQNRKWRRYHLGCHAKMHLQNGCLHDERHASLVCELSQFLVSVCMAYDFNSIIL